jgi:mRNA interferase MazF
MRGESMEIHQGDIYWAAPDGPQGPVPGIPHPYVVVQEDVFNRSRIPTVVVCALTTNRKRASLPGNVLLEPGEANLPRQSVVEVSKLSTVDKSQFGEYIGSLARPRIDQILAGIQFLQRMTGSGDPPA